MMGGCAMKVRDSGMPDEEMWASFFDPEHILSSFGISDNVSDLIEFGCGYGTFSLTASRLVSGTVHALDIEPGLIRLVRSRCAEAGLNNVKARVCDFVGLGSGVPDNSADAALLFNILHHDQPVALMAEAWRVLVPGGILAIIHWNHDPTTPRGPSLDIRPRPEQIVDWGGLAGFDINAIHRFDFPPYHYGLKFTKS